MLVAAGLACFVVGVYVVVVLGGGLMLGRTGAPSVALSVIATTIVALLFPLVQSRLERAAAGIGRPAAATPCDVLNRFSAAAESGDATSDLPVRMSKLLAEATGARWAQVWLEISGRLSLAATWPPDADADRSAPFPLGDPTDRTGDGTRALPVRHGGQQLAVLRLQQRPGSSLTAVEERLFAGLAAQAGLMLRLAGLRAELEDRQRELAARAGDLQASRERVVSTQDAERRRLERDIHDGAQQHLVALTVNLRLVQSIAARSPDRAAALLTQQAEAARVAMATLSSLSRGLYPRALADDGLLPALRLAAASSAIPIRIDTTTAERLPPPIEAALYFACMEAVQNAVKHSGARGVTVRVDQLPGRWRVTVADDGSGFDPTHVTGSSRGVGLANMRDRIDAVGGTLTVQSVPGKGTTVTASVPRDQPDECLATRAGSSWAV